MEEIKAYWHDLFADQQNKTDWWERKKQLWEREKGSIVKVQCKAAPLRSYRYDDKLVQEYQLHLKYLIKQEDHYHMEEELLSYLLEKRNSKIIRHEAIVPKRQKPVEISPHQENITEGRENFYYDRREAVRYAERWWNSYNPAFRTFEDDCTNYISQCLYAGGAPMQGSPNRERGWWYSGDNWSFSWSVAHSMRWYLSGSTAGLRGKELETPEELLPGDVICYDFQGDGRFDHTTIVTNFDAYNMPLVNAHTNNSRQRYWTYEDSAAWTPDIQYKFFRIGE